MTTYYVSKSGSDSNNGLGPDASHATNKPWLTIAKALGASGIASGDTVYIGPGTYRESVTVAMTSATAETFVLGDPANERGFKDGSGVLLTPDFVTLTSFTTNDTTTATAAALILAGRDYLTFEKIVFVGESATSPSCINATTVHSRNITFRECAFFMGNLSGSGFAYTSTFAESADWVVERCVFIGSCTQGIVITLTSGAGADYDSNFQIRNCMFLGAMAQGIQVTQTGGTTTNKGGGVDVRNCTFLSDGTFVRTNNANLSTSIPCTVENCFALTGNNVGLNANTAGQITEDYNRLVSPASTNVTAGTNSIIGSGNHAWIFEAGQSQLLLGRLPRPFGMPASGSPILGFGNGSGAPTVDLLNKARPAGGASTNNGVGALERHNTAVKETTVTDSGAGIKIVGPGDHEFQIPVDAASTTISVKGRYDTNHGTGSKPQALLLANGEIGVSAQTLTMSAAADTWETLTFSAITPTQKGVVTVRLVSRAAAGSGVAYFDTFAIT